MRNSDERTIAKGTPSAQLMQRAAEGIFKAVQFAGRTAVVCGKGNNAGDGYALACILIRNGLSVTIFRASDGFSKDGLYFYQMAKSLGAEEDSIESCYGFQGYDIVVDCLLGTGFRGEVSHEIKTAIESINATSAFVISADINSGINGDTGVADVAVNSDLTVSIGSFKTGLFLNDAPYFIEEMVNADIGIEPTEEYKLIDYDRLSLFEGISSEVMTIEEFYEKTGFSPEECSIAEIIGEESREKRKTIVVKTEHSAVIADIKYVYFCADYIRG